MSLSVPLSVSASGASLLISFHTRGEAVDAVTPAGLPQGPSPFEEDKLVYATRRTASSGQWRWIPPGVVVGCKVSALFPGLPVFRPLCPHKLLPLRYVHDYMFQGPPVWTHGGDGGFPLVRQCVPLHLPCALRYSAQLTCIAHESEKSGGRGEGGSLKVNCQGLASGCGSLWTRPVDVGVKEIYRRANRCPVKFPLIGNRPRCGWC